MKQLDPFIRVELEDERAQMHYLPRAGMEELPSIELHPLLAVIIDYLCRDWSQQDLATLLSERLGRSKAAMSEIIEDAELIFHGHLATSYEDSLVVSGPDTIERVLAKYAGSKVSLGPRDVVLQNNRSPFPTTLQWLVTHYCARGCIYCYAEPIRGRLPKDSTVSTERILQVIEESARLGVNTFFITGGEPFLRKDIYDVLAHAVAWGMKPEIYTKYAIGDHEADQMAAAGVPVLSLSIDSLDPAVAAKMSGIRTFADEMRATAKRLIERGIEVRANAVLIPESLHTIPATIEEMDRLGFSRVHLEAFSRTNDAEHDRYLPSEEEMDRMQEWVDEYQADPAHKIQVSFRRQVKARMTMETEVDRIQCQNGVTSLLLLPDGRVSRCDKRLPDTEIIVGDVTKQSVYEVWNSSEMVESLNPPRSLYEGTLCHDCDLFETCNQQSRCFYNAATTTGKSYGPNSYCSRYVAAHPPECEETALAS